MRLGRREPDPIRPAIERTIAEQPDWLRIPEPGLDATHLFMARRADLNPKLAVLRTLIRPSGFVWISRPKKLSKPNTDDRIRAAVLPRLTGST
jgi:hypothetical protein